MINWEQNDLIYLPFWLFILGLITFLIWYFLRNKSEKIKFIPLAIISITMIVLEVLKQIIAIINGYDFWNLPLHFCSLFLILFPLMVFGKGKIKEFGKTISFIASTLMFVLYMCSPNRIIGSNAIINMFTSFNSFHTVIYHHLAILFLLIGLALQLFDLNLNDAKYIVITLVVYGVVAIPLAHLLDINYCNLLSNSYEPFQQVIEKRGYPLYYIMMFSAGCLGGFIIFFLQYCCTNLIKQKK